jgi:hypothetical protein
MDRHGYMGTEAQVRMVIAYLSTVVRGHVRM